MALNPNALIDFDYFNTLWSGPAVEELIFDSYVNAISTAFELFCNRKLKERSYTFDSLEDDPENGVIFDLSYSVFDAPEQNIFWFPTYPVSEITYFSVSGEEIDRSPEDDYHGNNGYLLYFDIGKLVYYFGFDFPAYQNINVKWTGGYAVDSEEMSHLSYLCYSALGDTLNAPNNALMQSEKIGNYSYKLMATEYLERFEGLSPKVYKDIKKYRREVVT